MESVNLFSLSYEELVKYLAQHREVKFTREDWIVKLKRALRSSSPATLLRSSLELDRPIYVELLLEFYPEQKNIIFNAIYSAI